MLYSRAARFVPRFGSFPGFGAGVSLRMPPTAKKKVDCNRGGLAYLLHAE